MMLSKTIYRFICHKDDICCCEENGFIRLTHDVRFWLHQKSPDCSVVEQFTYVIVDIYDERAALEFKLRFG